MRAASLLLSTDAPSHCAMLHTRAAAAPAAFAVPGGDGTRGVRCDLPPAGAPAALTAPGCSSFWVYAPGARRHRSASDTPLKNTCCGGMT